MRTKFVAKIILVHPALIVQKKPSNEAQELFSLLAAFTGRVADWLRLRSAAPPCGCEKQNRIELGV